jgi:hypothetical protein
MGQQRDLGCAGSPWQSVQWSRGRDELPRPSWLVWRDGSLIRGTPRDARVIARPAMAVSN